MTAGAVVEHIENNPGIPWNAQTFRDTFKAGSPETEVNGIATAYTATLDLLRRANAAGTNLAIAHELAFWSGADTTKELEADSVYNVQSGLLCQEQYGGLAIPRSHARAPAGRDLGWASPSVGMDGACQRG
jgi:hypothetical protein